MIKAIKSNRTFETSASFQIVYEWENLLADLWGVPVYKGDILVKMVSNVLPSTTIRNKLLRGYFYQKGMKTNSLVFHMTPITKTAVAKNDIPIIIDFWRGTNLKDFMNSYSKCHLVIVTSREVLNYLKNKVNLNLKYLPLTLPDRYFLGDLCSFDYQQILSAKDIDIIQPGRTNRIFNEWVEKYLIKYPATHYVFQKIINSKLYFFSNKYGLLGETKTRDQYFSILLRSKIALYSSPGIDNGLERTGGFNPLTPKFLECLATLNYVIARYEENEEFEDVKSFCANFYDYETFEKQATTYLDQGSLSFFAASNPFLKARLTSTVFASFNS